MQKYFSQKKSGYVMLITAITFMMISLIIIFGLATPILKQILVSRDIWTAKQSYYLSEAGVEDMLYRVKDATYSQHINSIETLMINGFTATTTTSGSLTGLSGLAITTLSNDSGYQKKITASIKLGSGVDFFYAMQTGQGGFSMSGSSGIVGNILSGGPITGCSSCYITGSAIVSNSPDMTENQSNDLPSSPANTITFGDAAATQDLAQSFQVSSTSILTEVSLYLEKVGSPNDLTVKIIKNNNGSPSSSGADVVSSAVLPAANIATSFGWVDVSLSPNPSLVVGNTYWIVLDGSTGSASKKYIIGSNIDSNYVNGTANRGSLGGSWSTTGYDAYFRLYLGGFFGSITGGDQNNQLSIGSTASDTTWAHNVTYVSATGPIWCQTSLLNNKACTQKDDPDATPFPVSDSDISGWESEAAAGGTMNGNYTKTDSSNNSLGPKKVIGNMTIAGSATLNVTGILYITGNLTVGGSGKIKLASSYGSNSGVIVVDGQVTINGSGGVNGTGQTGSYMMVVTNSTCPVGTCNGSNDGNNAIEITGSGGAVILNAQKGTLEFTGSANANEATANEIIMSGSTKITYQNGVANPNFSSGPSGGENVTGWSELNQ